MFPCSALSIPAQNQALSEPEKAPRVGTCAKVTKVFLNVAKGLLFLLALSINPAQADHLRSGVTEVYQNQLQAGTFSYWQQRADMCNYRSLNLEDQARDAREQGNAAEAHRLDEKSREASQQAYAAQQKIQDIRAQENRPWLDHKQSKSLGHSYVTAPAPQLHSTLSLTSGGAPAPTPSPLPGDSSSAFGSSYAPTTYGGARAPEPSLTKYAYERYESPTTRGSPSLFQQQNVRDLLGLNRR